MKIIGSFHVCYLHLLVLILYITSLSIETFSPKGIWKKSKGKNEKSWLSPGIEPRATGFSHQYSNH